MKSLNEVLGAMSQAVSEVGNKYRLADGCYTNERGEVDLVGRALVSLGYELPPQDSWLNYRGIFTVAEHYGWQIEPHGLAALAAAQTYTDNNRTWGDALSDVIRDMFASSAV